MNLVVHGHTADETVRPCVADVVIEHRERARTDKGIRAEGISPSVAVVPETVGGRIIYAAVRIVPIWSSGRIEEGSLANCTSVSVVGI